MCVRTVFGEGVAGLQRKDIEGGGVREVRAAEPASYILMVQRWWSFLSMVSLQSWLKCRSRLPRSP